MKKTYINPEMEIVKLQTMQMLAASTNVELSNQTLNKESDLLGHDDDFEW